MWWTVAILISISCAAAFVNRSFSYWRRLGFPEVKPELMFGNVKPVVRGVKSFGVTIYELYRQTNAQSFVGIYLFFRPALLINDVNLVKCVLNSDFQHFHDRGVYSNVKHDPLSGGLFQLNGREWRELRAKMTPAFSSTKLKNMFAIFHDVGMRLEQLVARRADDGSVVEMKDILSRYIVDIVANTIFGCEVNTIEQPKHKFRDVGKSFTEPSIVNGFRNAGFFLWPNLLRYTRIKFLPESMRKFCVDLVTTTVEARERDGLVRKDLMQSMIQLRNNNTIDHSDAVELDVKAAQSMTFEQIAAQVFIFYIAGTESTSATASFTLHELSQNPQLMERAQKDVDDALSGNNRVISYESIKAMSFIDLCVKETLRKYPALPLLNRECTKDFQIPGSQHVIPKGTAVVISLLGLHRDEKNFHNAHIYDPDRFIRADFNSKAYLPFGDGQRNCIAYRMGVLATKVALAILLSKFRFEAVKQYELEFEPNTIALDAKGGINLKVSHR